MSTRTLTAVLAAVAMLSAGCQATKPQADLNHARVKQIQIGQTTQAQVQQMFGEPTDRQIDPKTGDTWLYYSGENRGKYVGRFVGGALLDAATSVVPGGDLVPTDQTGESETTLEVEFDLNGVVTNYSYYAAGER